MTNFVGMPDVGAAIARRGWNTLRDADSLLATLAHDMRLECLLACVAERLDRVLVAQTAIAGISSRKSGTPTPSVAADDDRDAVADGLLRTYQRSLGVPADRSIDECDRARLSKRARNVVRRSGATLLSHLTREALLAIRYCGVTTADEIVAWARQQMESA